MSAAAAAACLAATKLPATKLSVLHLLHTCSAHILPNNLYLIADLQLTYMDVRLLALLTCC